MEGILQPLVPDIVCLRHREGWRVGGQASIWRLLVIRQASVGRVGAVRVQRGRQVLAQAPVLAQVLVVLDRLIQAPELAEQGHVQLPQAHLQKTGSGRGLEGQPPLRPSQSSQAQVSADSFESFGKSVTPICKTGPRQQKGKK